MKYIKLTQGKRAMVDDEDFEWLNKRKWNTQKIRSRFYAVTHASIDKKIITIFIHRMILNAPENKQVDHINRNGLDNRKENLRLCTNSENNHNRGKFINSTSKYKGICWDKKSKKWKAQISRNKKHYNLGHFNSEYLASQAFDKMAIKLFGRYATINFPKS